MCLKKIRLVVENSLRFLRHSRNLDLNDGSARALAGGWLTGADMLSLREGLQGTGLDKESVEQVLANYRTTAQEERERQEAATDEAV